MYRCPKCESACNSLLIPTWDGAIQSWICPGCGWCNSDIETKVSTSTENIDLGRTTTSTEVENERVY